MSTDPLLKYRELARDIYSEFVRIDGGSRKVAEMLAAHDVKVLDQRMYCDTCHNPLVSEAVHDKALVNAARLEEAKHIFQFYRECHFVSGPGHIEFDFAKFGQFRREHEEALLRALSDSKERVGQ